MLECHLLFHKQLTKHIKAACRQAVIGALEIVTQKQNRLTWSLQFFYIPTLLSCSTSKFKTTGIYSHTKAKASNRNLFIPRDLLVFTFLQGFICYLFQVNQLITSIKGIYKTVRKWLNWLDRIVCRHLKVVRKELGRGTVNSEIKLRESLLNKDQWKQQAEATL